MILSVFEKQLRLIDLRCGRRVAGFARLKL